MSAARHRPGYEAEHAERGADAVTGFLPVVLLHALPLESSMWDAVTPRLRARGHQVIAFDQRGFGAAPLGGLPPSLDLVADDLVQELDRRGIGEVALVGCSMGGYVAMSFLRRHPHRVRALALLAARGAADSAETAARRRRFAERVLDDSAHGRLVAETTPSLLGATTRTRQPHVTRHVTALARAARPRSVAWAQRAIAARADSTPTLRAADIPAVVVIGDEDELVSPDEARETAEPLPRGRLVTLPGVGHLAPLEAPEATLKTLMDLLAHTETAVTKPC